MMRVLFLITAACVLLAPGAHAFFDDFETYVDQNDFNASWRPFGDPVEPVSDLVYSGSQSVYQGTGSQQSAHYVDPIPTTQLYFSFWFYDSESGMDRTYAMAYSKAGTAWGGALQQILAIGKYNKQTTKYHARVAFGSDNWFALDDGPDRSIGWHFAEIIGKQDGTVDFKIDGILGATKAVANVDFNWAVVGTGLPTYYGMWFDDITMIDITAVPEPGSLPALCAGVIGLAGCIRRRR